ncbi:hypothetical protein Taro_029667 [Colocasia esculenta]|uniref:Uncharacterized protein n=1 Tax=Colocasia esculenta TaxID=4460 RepID=A0A843W0Y0_COLES|nr:hypothetical protein [Colocasia esculenta]
MQSQHEEEKEYFFFDSLDSFSTCSSSASSEETLSKNLESEFENFDYQVWMSHPRSICERRNKFLCQMGFDELVPSDLYESQEIEEGSHGSSPDHLELDRLTETSGAVLDSLGDRNIGEKSEERSDLHCCISDLDRGKRFVVHQFSQENLLSTTLTEVESGRLITWEEFEMSLGFSQSVQQLMLKNSVTCGEKRDRGTATRKKKSKGWWKSLSARRHFGDLCNCSIPVQDAQVHKAGRTKMHHHGKRYKEFSAISMGQEFQAHKGPIWTMKFSPDGRYLATGGEDHVVRIWHVKKVENPDEFLFEGCVHKFVDKVEGGKIILKSKLPDSTSVVIPRETFKLEEMPLHEFDGHTSDVLDLSWSESNCLLTSSKDKTVRMWQVGQNHCLKVFRHNNYVTCVQFHPVDDGLFISGSIDGKARIWGISENRVVDWVDIRDIITAVCYRPDGQGFVVGSINGNCRFFYLSGNGLQLDAELYIQGRKKTTGKRITGFQFPPQDPEKVMITSADAKVRIFDGVNIIHKYRGLRKSRSQLSATFTSDGRQIVSVGEDSRVYIWNYNTSGDTQSSEGTKSVRSCQYFFSKGASVAIPWPGMDDMTSATQNTSSLLPLQGQRSSGASPWARDAERFSLGSWFFADCPSRVSATWPEEKLCLWAEPADPARHCCAHHGQEDHQPKTQRTPTSNDAWSRVIVTAGHDGAVRSFYYYALPVRL